CSDALAGHLAHEAERQRPPLAEAASHTHPKGRLRAALWRALLTAANRGLKIAAALFGTPFRGVGGIKKGRQDEVQTGAAACGTRRRGGCSRPRRAQLRSSPGNAVEARQPARLRSVRCLAEADGRAARGGACSACESYVEQLRD